MTQRIDYNNIWYLDLSAQKALLDKVSKACKHHDIHLQPWTRTTSIELGLIFIYGKDSYEQLISLLHIQLTHQRNRIIVLNCAPVKLDTETILKIYNYGAEYYFEQCTLEDSFECIVETLIRWRNIEIILQAPTVKKNIVGESLTMKKLLRSIIEVAAFSDASILIEGERGTGKELIAKLIHELDRKRSTNQLVLIDCTTIRPELSGSEFFGHEKGSYTGADNNREGAFALANNGTLFLDEVGETPLKMQAELLRIIQEGTYKKLGSNFWKHTSFRLVCATNRNLVQECEQGNFRKDLYDRISTWNCSMPPLRDRREDIPHLLNFFLSKKFGDQVPPIDDSVLLYLQNKDYPGNVRELQNLVNKIALKHIGKGPITLGDIPEHDRTVCFKHEENWYESRVFTEKIMEALNSGYDAKHIMDTIKSLVTKIALATATNNKEVSMLLGKSERWIQLQKAKER